MLCKLLERMTVRQLLAYLSSADLHPPLQSGFRPGHILLSVDHGDFATLVLLDLWVAFDIVDYDILLQRLETSFGIRGTALSWFQTYLSGRTQYVRCGATRSSAIPLVCGVPQGTVLGPVLFILYVATLDDLIILAVRLTTIGCRAFPVAEAHIWNILPVHITSASSLTAFKQQLKLHLFRFSFPGLSPV